MEVGTDISFYQLKENHDAIYIATGTQFSRKVDIPGENLKGVYHGLEFLRDINLGRNIKVGDKVAVIGGGNTAIDAARCAVRLGAKQVTILYRRTIEDMPADEREVRDAIEEGINIIPLTAPRSFEEDEREERDEGIKGNDQDEGVKEVKGSEINEGTK